MHVASDEAIPTLSQPVGAINPGTSAADQDVFSAIPRAEIQSHNGVIRFRRPLFAAEYPAVPQVPVSPLADKIPRQLYRKAETLQDQLTDRERQLLVQCLGLVGKGLAYPETLTPSELNDLLGRPTPDIVRVNLERATGGTLTTPAEFWAKARTAREPGNWGSLSLEELKLLATNLRWIEPTGLDSLFLPSKYDGTPGYDSLIRLLLNREGHDGEAASVAFQQLADVLIDHIVPGVPIPQSATLESAFNPASIPAHIRPPIPVRIPVDSTLPEREQLDQWGQPKWPQGGPFPIRAENLFFKETMPKLRAENPQLDDVGELLKVKWATISEEEKDRLETMSEVLRLAAWDEYDWKEELRARGAIFRVDRPNSSVYTLPARTRTEDSSS